MFATSEVTNAKWIQSLSVGDRCNIFIADKTTHQNRVHLVEVKAIEPYKLTVTVFAKTNFDLLIDRVSGYIILSSNSSFYGWLTV